jgi:hypothetical protein
MVMGKNGVPSACLDFTRGAWRNRREKEMRRSSYERLGRAEGRNEFLDLAATVGKLDE